MTFNSPYNFIPAPKEEEVYKPFWAEEVSHDIPFQDGESGEIELKITAETPIFIRNGHSKLDKEIFEKYKAGKILQPSDSERESINRYLDFSNVECNGKKQYFIPATSMKGMIRSVLEIMSFSRMDQVDGSSFFGLRDMNNLEYKSETRQDKLKSGWLKKEGDCWRIYEVEHVRVSMSDIEARYNLGFGTIQNAESAVDKYKKLNGKKISNVKLKYVKDLIKRIGNKSLKYGRLYKFDDSGDFIGDIVFYGSIGNKHYDFVFGKDSKNIYPVNEKLIKNIEELEDQSWTFHKCSNQIPVFFKEQNGKVKHFGLSKLYCLNNGHFIKELNPLKSYSLAEKNNKFDNFKYDLASLIFGNEKCNNSLKGRVVIGHAMSENATASSNNEERVLGSPKPSFYPAYIKQTKDLIESKNQEKDYYKTYLNNDAELRGFKRYPLHLEIKAGDLSNNENIATEFIPLAENTVFYSKIRYHNLRKVELGALLSAITMHNCPNAFHNIGGAKPYGFGKVKVEIENSNPERDNELMAYFEYEMNKHTLSKSQERTTWLQSPCMIELFSLSQTALESTDQLLTYPKLEDNTIQDKKNRNHFNNIKKKSQSLNTFSQKNTCPNVVSLLTNEDVVKKIEKERLANFKLISSNKMRKEQIIQKKELDKRAKLDEDNRVYDEKLKKGDTYLDAGDFYMARQQYIKAGELFPKESGHIKKLESLDYLILESNKALSLKKVQEENKLKKEEAQKELLESGLSIPNEYNDFNKGKKIIESFYKAKNQDFIVDKNAEVLKSFVQRCIIRNNKRWKKYNAQDWKLVIKWVGPDTAEKWFNEIIKNA